MRCQVCFDPIGDLPGDLACAACAAPHHADCWAYAGVCTTYGCGETRGRPLARDPASTAPLVIGEHAPLAPAGTTQFRGLARWLRRRAEAWPTTVPAGLGGAGLLLMGIWGQFSADIETGMALVILGIGLLHGLVTPFLAPLQHHRPLATTAAGLVAFTMAGLMLGSQRYPRLGIWHSGFLALWISSATVAAASMADYLAGPRSWLAERWGRAPIPLRVGLTFLFSGLLWYVFALAFEVRYGGPDELFTIALLSAMCTACGLPALERGKTLYLESLPPARR